MKNGRYEEDGLIIWYFNDRVHRIDRPAWVEEGGSETWYLSGEMHRIDGPAVKWADGGEE
jgi:hypothetical protein